MHIVAGRHPRYFCKKIRIMLTREEIEQIGRECAEQKMTLRNYLARKGIAPHQYYRWKRNQTTCHRSQELPFLWQPRSGGANKNLSQDGTWNSAVR